MGKVLMWAPMVRRDKKIISKRKSAVVWAMGKAQFGGLVMIR